MTSSSDQTNRLGQDGSRRGITFADRLVAEATRLGRRDEDLTGRQISAAEAIARRQDTDFEQRVTHRALALPGAERLRDAVDRTGAAARWVAVIAALLTAIAGAAAVRASLGAADRDPVNVFWFLLTILGIQTLALVIWFVFMMLRPRDPGALSFGTLVLNGARWIASRLASGPDHGAAMTARATVLGHGPIAKWTVSRISHLLWMTFDIGALVALIALLSARHYTFGWETTILNDETYVGMTRILAIVPDAVGFPVPDDAAIRASHWTGEGVVPEAHRQAWSGFLAGCLTLYGLVPRLLLFMLATSMTSMTRRRFRLDTSHPGYARLTPRLMPASSSIGVVDAETSSPSDLSAPPADTPAPTRDLGRPVVIGIEIDPEGRDWPPRADGIDLEDWGLVDTREDRRRVLDSLRAGDQEPGPLVVVCCLTTTPDRGVVGYLTQLQSCVRHPIEVVLTNGERLRRRSSADLASGRISDWHEKLREADLDHAHELDLENWTAASSAKLAAIVNGDDDAAGPMHRFHEAVALIATHAGRWREIPSQRAQFDLHRAIARIYRDRTVSWRDLLTDDPRALVSDIGEGVRPATQHVVSLLPDRLKRSRKWITAGVLAGAFGGLAAVTFIAPAAIGTLPIWAGMGGVVGGLLTPGQKKETEDEDTEFTPSAGDAVRSAALYAMLLDLQGLPERRITAILDEVVDDGDTELTTPDEMDAWLDDLRHRYAMALSREVSS